MPAIHPLPPAVKAKMINQLSFLYGEEQAPMLLDRILESIQGHFSEAYQPREMSLDERDIVLITYPDQLREAGEAPLRTLKTFLSRHLKDLISIIHLLPFYPYSSDDGFSVMDYRKVNPDFGEWDDIERIRIDFQLMFDAVINHISAKSRWMRHFLAGEASHRDYFIVVNPNEDLSSVVRPRDLPLLTPFHTNHGDVHLWTTFSADQIDLNYANPEVLLEIIDLLFFYIERGARIIRLDAIAYLWKEIGTPCIHLPQVHTIVQLVRSLLDAFAPGTLLLTETNVPHDENVSYFGTGEDEAHMVYQFTLPPLILHTLLNGDASHLTEWASDLKFPGKKATFFNFTASHDGIGLRPARDILPDEALDTMITLCEERGGGISYRRLGNHDRQPYELNINYFDALSDSIEIGKQPQRAIARFLCSQAIMLSFAGLPGIYFHSLFGSRNDHKGVERTGQLRSINREKFKMRSFARELHQPTSLRRGVFQGYKKLLSVRRSLPALNPWGDQEVIQVGKGVFGLIRKSPVEGERILCLHEVAGQSCMLNDVIHEKPSGPAHDVLAKEDIDLSAIPLSPYQVRWIRLDHGQMR
jgi:glycosidase